MGHCIGQTDYLSARCLCKDGGYMNTEIILSVDSIEKKFPGVKALDSVSFDLKKGEVHALVGENGAGKSTLMHILGGIHQPDAGNIILYNSKIILNNPLEAVRHGIGIVFQELSLIQELSVAENIFPTNKPCNQIGMIQFKELYKKTEELLEIFGETIDPKIPVKHLTVAKQQIVEILKAMAREPKILILDEPFSALDVKSQIELVNIINRYSLENHISIVLTTHEVELVSQFADTLYLISSGNKLSSKGTPNEIFSQPKLLEDFNLQQPSIFKLFYMLNQAGFSFKMPNNTEEAFNTLKEHLLIQC